MEEVKSGKIERVLDIYSKLMAGATVYKEQLATEFGVNEKSIQRDIDDIRDYLETHDQNGLLNSVIFDYSTRGYRLEQIYGIKLTNPEILAICKILLDSRAFTKDEMADILGRLIDNCVPRDNRKVVESLIRNEEFHYMELNHHTPFMDKMWQIGVAISKRSYIEITYKKLKEKEPVKRKLAPVAIMFSEYYFYMAAFIQNREDVDHPEKISEITPTIYRLDRIDSLRILKEHYSQPSMNRFEEGEFRKRIFFMTGGKLRRVRFEYSGLSIEAVLDRIPTAKILREEDGVYTIEAEVYGNGIDRWLRGQGDDVKIIEKKHDGC